MLIPYIFAVAVLPMVTPVVTLPDVVAFEANRGDEVTEQQQTAATKQYEQLQVRMDQAMNEYLAPLREAKTAEERDAIELDPAKDPRELFLSPMLKFAKDHPGTDACLLALGEVIRMSSGDEGKSWMTDEAVDVLLVDFIEHDGLQDLVRFAHYNRPSTAIFRLLRGIVDDAPSRDVRAASMYSLSKLLGKDKETRAESRGLLDRIEKEFANVTFIRETTYGQKVQGDIFELEHLQIGDVAPEIIGKSLDGNLMQLSAFRGKVVLLDFWGDW